MHSKILLTLFVLFSFYAFYDTLSDKRYTWITKESKIGVGFLTNALTLSGLINLLEIYNVQLHYIVYLFLLLTLCISIQLLSTYYGGYKYNIPYSDTSELAEKLKNVLRYQGYTDVVQSVDNNANIFRFKDEQKTIALELRERVFREKAHHYLKFKKWHDKDSRDEIVEAMDNELERYELKTASPIYRTFEIVFVVAFILGFMVYYNYESVQPNRISIYDQETVLVLTNHDLQVLDPTFLANFEEAFKGSHAYLDKKINPDSIANDFIEITYNNSYKTLFIGPVNSYLYVDFEKMKTASLWNQIMVRTYGLIFENEGAYYHFYVPHSFYDELTGVIKNQ